MTERRYNEEEVAAIFTRASQAQAAQQNGLVPLASDEGMTLAQLQDIGREVGIDPQQIAAAARSVGRTGRPTTRKFLGFTIGVGRTVELDRKISEAEWERLVVDLRETFDARGQIRSEGNFRQWTNGNLQALLEPTESGHRLRLQTVKGDSRAWMTGGIMMLASAAIMGLVAALYLIPNRSEGLETVVSFGIIGIGMLMAGAVRLPSWARLRRQQMAEVASRLAESTSR